MCVRVERVGLFVWLRSLTLCGQTGGTDVWKKGRLVVSCFLPSFFFILSNCNFQFLPPVRHLLCLCASYLSVQGWTKRKTCWAISFSARTSNRDHRRRVTPFTFFQDWVKIWTCKPKLKSAHMISESAVKRKKKEKKANGRKKGMYVRLIAPLYWLPPLWLFIDLAAETKCGSQSADKWLTGLRPSYKGLWSLPCELRQVGPPPE